MLKNTFPLILLIFNFCNVIWTAPQSGPSVDLGIYKVAIDTNDGLAVRRDINIDLPFFKVKKTTEVGIGKPMVSNSDDDDSESDEMEKRRKKREIGTMEAANETANVLKLVRKKREPCYTYVRPVQPQQPQQPDTDGDGGDTDGDGEEARRRRSAMSKRNSARKNKGQSRKRQKGRRRRRRQIATEDFAEILPAEKNGNRFRESLNNALQKAKSVWNSFLQTTEEIVKDVKQSIVSLRSGTKENPQNFEQPK